MAEATILMVLSKMAQPIRGEISLLINSTEEAKKLESNLKKKIQPVLEDAERKGLMEESVKTWLDKLQEIAYDIDDVLDEWEWQNFKIQNEDPCESLASSDNPWEKVSSFLQSVCLCFKSVVKRREVSLNIKQLNERLDTIYEENENKFQFVQISSRDHSQDFKRIHQTASEGKVSEIIGRDIEKGKLVRELLSERSSSSSQTKNGIPIISIVGAGGMGKTALARLVFNDDRIKNHFQVKMWVCVSDSFDQIKIAEAILEEINQKKPDVSTFQTLLRCIKDALSGKNFLLVLDDVWTEDYKMWEQLRNFLDNIGAPNSRILVTTRKIRVTEVMGSMQIQSLNLLSNEDCPKVLNQIAFRLRTEQECEILRDIGLEIVKKCKGLPLAIEVIGHLLKYKSSEEEWREVLESDLWKLKDAQTGIFASLALSYNELHPVAKRCFSYCAIFPKDTYLEPDTLIRMWCAQGFLSSTTSDDDMEQKGRKIFDDLIMHSLFQDVIEDSLGNHPIRYKMHGVVHDFAQFLSKNECLIVENVDGEGTSADVRSARHLNLLVDKDKVDKIDENCGSFLNEKCRSFLTENNNISKNLFRHLKKVRVLILKYCFSKVIPSELGSLIHLKYLDLTGSEIEELPEAICDLYILETLILVSCENLSAFPQWIDKLRKLRHIFNDWTNNMEFPNMEFPEGSEELTNLRTLSEIHVSSHTKWKGLEFLGKMNKLGGSLMISVEGLDNEDAENRDLLLEAAEKAELEKKKSIQQLQLCYNEKVPIAVVKALQPHSELKEVTFQGSCLPEWLTTLTKLKKLTISITEGVLADHLPALRNLALLEVLFLKNIHEMKIPNLEELYAFESLKILTFYNCTEWEEWEDISEEEENNINLSIFPSLQELRFHGCTKLKALPHRLLGRSPSLKHLDVLRCKELKERYQDWESVSQIHGISHVTAKIR